MDEEDEKEIAKLMKQACEQSRGYADHFGWAIDRDIEEWGVITSLQESLEEENLSFFDNIQRRGRGNDPPDCEADLKSGGIVGLEVTELVSGEAIKAFKAGHKYAWASWDETDLIEDVEKRLQAKNKRHKLKGGPYDEYVVVIHTDEPILDFEFADKTLGNRKFGPYPEMDRAFLLISYDPKYQKCPYIELKI